MKLFRVVVVACVATFAIPASAEWTKNESYEFSAKTSLKIVEPVNAKAIVTIGSETKEETLPAIFALPDADTYVSVKIVAADGDTWSGKVEIKARKQTVLNLAHTAKQGAPVAAAGKFIGRFENATHTCGSKDRVDKFVAMRDGKSVIDLPLGPNKMMNNIELEPGNYTVRIFRAGVFVKALDLNVTKDGWIFRYGC